MRGNFRSGRHRAAVTNNFVDLKAAIVSFAEAGLRTVFLHQDKAADALIKGVAYLGVLLVATQDTALQAAEYRLSPALLDRPRETPAYRQLPPCWSSGCARHSSYPRTKPARPGSQPLHRIRA